MLSLVFLLSGLAASRRASRCCAWCSATECSLMDPTPEELAFIAAHRLAVAYGFSQGDLGEQLVAFVCAFRHDGRCDGAIWLPDRGPVPVGVQPVTEPPEKVRDWRRAFDL
jgi:hypothetical protein